MPEYFRDGEYLEGNTLIGNKFYYCEECGHKIYGKSLSITISLDPDIIPKFSIPKSPKWIRPICCGDCYIRHEASLGGGVESGWREKRRMDYKQEEKEILELFRRWESDKTLKELEPDWLEYCIRKYTIKNIK